MLVNSYTQCMQGCNLTGKQCTDSAKLKRSTDTARAWAKFAGIVVAGTATGVIAGGPGTAAAGFVMGVGVGAIIGGVDLWLINEEFKFGIRKCRESYDFCVKGCEAYRPKPIGTGAGGV